MASCLLTEISLNLLGNKFYSPDGTHVKNLLSLCKIPEIAPPSSEPSLQNILCISETALGETDNLQSEVIVVNDSDGDEEDKPQASVGQVHSYDVPNSKAIDQHFKYKINDNIGSEDVDRRLSSIIKASSKEYDQMKNESIAAKKEFQRLLSTTRREGIQAYYKSERKKLIKEKNLLLNFMKLIKEDTICPKHVLSRVESDMHKARILFNSTSCTLTKK